MGDELVSALLQAEGLRVVLALTGALCRHARGLARLRPGSAAGVGGLFLQPLPGGDLEAFAAEITCQFCSAHDVVSGEEIRQLLQAAGEPARAERSR